VRKLKCILAQAADVLYIIESSRLKSKRRMWTKNWNMAKYTTLQKLGKNNPDDFKNYLRMGSEIFDHLLCSVKPQYYKKRGTVKRKSVPAEYSKQSSTAKFLIYKYL
jgi:hypothetical protein